MAFKFEFYEPVAVMLCGSATGERGEVIGRAEYPNSQPSYLVRYRSGSRNTEERWWGEDALIPGNAWRPQSDQNEPLS